MCDALGDPHVFATHSFADTFCPYLADFILKWRNASWSQPVDDDDAAERGPSPYDRDRGSKSPFATGLSSAEVKQRKWTLLAENPALAAHFFALKTELYLEHICVGIMNASAYWSRYEWQSRGSTHAHYFIWLRDVPSVDHLETWIREELEAVRVSRDADEGDDPDRPSYTSDELDTVEEALNHRARTDASTVAAAEWWSGRCQHWNEAWDEEARVPDMRTDVPHPANKRFSELSDMADLDGYDPCSNLKRDEAPDWLVDDVNACRNWMTRHTDHTPYCLRRNKDTGVLFCRFHFPLAGHDPQDKPHFFVERKGGHFRWKVHLGMNDPLLNTVNLWQMAAHRANVDFRPLFDHHTAIEYSTKYATKAEKGSNAMEAVFSHAIARASKNYDDDATALHAYASFLVQTVGARDWSSQEVGHCFYGWKTCIASHEFDYATLSARRALVPDVSYKKNDDTVVSDNKWDLYLRRIEFVSRSKKGEDPKQRQLEAFFDKVESAELTSVDDYDNIAGCSFHEFYSQYALKSAGKNAKGARSIVRRKMPTVVVIKPRMPRTWMNDGHPKRREYCRMRLLLHKQFLDLPAYLQYMTSHAWDWEVRLAETQHEPLFMMCS